LKVYANNDINPYPLNGSPIFLTSYALRFPNWLFSIVAASMLRIDETARSSMVINLMKKTKK